MHRCNFYLIKQKHFLLQYKAKTKFFIPFFVPISLQTWRIMVGKQGELKGASIRKTYKRNHKVTLSGKFYSKIGLSSHVPEIVTLFCFFLGCLIQCKEQYICYLRYSSFFRIQWFDWLRGFLILNRSNNSFPKYGVRTVN